MPLPVEELEPTLDDGIKIVLAWGMGAITKHGIENHLMYALDTYAEGVVATTRLDVAAKTALLTEEDTKWPQVFVKTRATLLPMVELYSPGNEFTRPRIVVLAIPDKLPGDGVPAQKINKVSNDIKTGLNGLFAAHDGRAVFTLVRENGCVLVCEPRLSLASSEPEPGAFEKYVNRGMAFDDTLKNGWTGDDIIKSLKSRQRYDPDCGALARRVYTL